MIAALDNNLAGASPSPLAQALTTPLMITLARAIYNPRPGGVITARTGRPDPGELCSYTSKATVEQRLFDAFIPAAYQPANLRHRCRWSSNDAERWLTFLASHLDRNPKSTSELAWWQLPTARYLGPTFGVVVGASLGLVVALSLGPSVRPATVVAVIFAAWVGVGVGHGVATQPPPAQGLRFSVRSLLLHGLRSGDSTGIAALSPATLATLLLTGFTGGLTGTRADLTFAATPRQLLTQDRRTLAVLVLITTLTAGITCGLTAYYLSGLDAGLTGWLFGELTGLVIGLTLGATNTARLSTPSHAATSPPPHDCPGGSWTSWPTHTSSTASSAKPEPPTNSDTLTSNTASPYDADPNGHTTNHDGTRQQGAVGSPRCAAARQESIAALRAAECTSKAN